MTKVLLLSRYGRLGASSRLRSYQYLPYLKSCGFDIDVAPFFDDAYLQRYYAGLGKSAAQAVAGYRRRCRDLLTCGRYELLWIEGELLPWLPAWVEAVLARFGRPYVVDYDDALFHRYDLHPNGLVRRLLGGKIDGVMRGAKTVIAGSDYLAERAVAAGAKRVAYLPTSIDLDRYPVCPASANDMPTVGWIGSRSTAPYLDMLSDALADIGRRMPLRVKLVGIRPQDLSTPIAGAEYLPWSEDTEVAAIQSFDIGVMPLPDTPWERGKCGYKLIQYMACGKPVVASAVGANRRIVGSGNDGFLATSEQEWKTALLELLNDPALRGRLGRNGRDKVERDYCIQVNGPKLAALLREAAD